MRVVCDLSNNTPEDIRDGRLKVAFVPETLSEFWWLIKAYGTDALSHAPGPRDRERPA